MHIREKSILPALLTSQKPAPQQSLASEQRTSRTLPSWLFKDRSQFFLEWWILHGGAVMPHLLCTEVSNI